MSPLGESIKRRLRPAVYRMRRLGEQLQQRIRPAIPWDGRHHPVLERFEPWRGEADGRFVHDFLGVRTDPKFRAELSPDPPGGLATHHPEPDWTYFELVFVLESVVAAIESDRESFTMFELGAGYGPWLVTAATAFRRLSDRPVRLTGVEMEPHRFEWMKQHLANNGIDPERHRLLHAAVSDRDGEAVFHSRTRPDVEYGLRVSGRTTGRRDDPDPSEGRVRRVGLTELLENSTTIDLIHIDVQGEEWRVLQPVADELERKARRVVVATHSRSIHRRIRQRFGGGSWDCRWDFGLRRRERTPFGHVRFLDGLLAFVNRRI